MMNEWRLEDPGGGCSPVTVNGGTCSWVGREQSRLGWGSFCLPALLSKVEDGRRSPGPLGTTGGPSTALCLRAPGCWLCSE